MNNNFQSNIIVEDSARQDFDDKMCNCDVKKTATQYRVAFQTIREGEGKTLSSIQCTLGDML